MQNKKKEFDGEEQMMPTQDSWKFGIHEYELKEHYPYGMKSIFDVKNM